MKIHHKGQQKYGVDQVAQIITFGKLQARAVLRDVGRVLQIPYGQVDRLCKMVPNNPAAPVTLQEAIDSEQRLQEERDNDPAVAQLIEISLKLEGLYRHASTHAAGVVIGDRPLEKLVPLYRDPKSDMPVTQFNKKWVENAGLVKFDFLGLKTLTVLERAVELLAKTGIEIDLSKLALDDEKTFTMLGNGDTVGVFQLESAGMRDVLRKMQPDCFEDIIALVALYRPGPMDNIPRYIACKKGEEEPDYMHDMLKPVLEETYGVPIYQEQVMQIAQVMSGFSLGEADLLRRAMGKKIKEEMQAQKSRFLEGATENGVDQKNASAVFDQVDRFAGYGFNKSHAAAYALIAYQTAYLKAHYPAQYMAAVLSNNMNDIKTVTFFMEECNRMGMKVLGPDVNESWYKFAVNENGEIRFGLGAIKGVGHGPVKNIVEQRKEEGKFHSIFDFVKKVSLKDCNKRVLESLAMAGAFDSFKGLHRAQYFGLDEQQQSLIEKSIKFGQAFQAKNNTNQASLFDAFGETVELAEPNIPQVEEWSTFELLTKEKEVVGIYLTGHPLQDYKLELNYFCDINLKVLNEKLQELPEREFSFIGLANSAANLESRRGTKYGVLELQDMEGQMEFRLFGEQYLKFMHFLVPGNFLHIKGKVQQRPKYYKSDEFQKEFRILHIELLDDVREKLTASLYVRWDFEDMKKDTISSIEKLVKNHKGKKQLIFELLDRESKSFITLNSRKFQTSVSNDFLEGLQNMDGFLGYSINKSKMDTYLYKLKEEQIVT